MKLLSVVIIAGLFCESNQTEKFNQFFPPPPRCSPDECWTQWFDRDDPTVTGDWETVSNLRRSYPGKICGNPIEIEATTLSGTPSSATGDVFYRNDVNSGLICRNDDQVCKCQDYRVRFRCPPSFCYPVCWTKWYYLHELSLGPNFWTQLETNNPGYKCDHPLIQISSSHSSNRAAVAEENVTFDANSGFICHNLYLKIQGCSGYKVRFGCRCCEMENVVAY